MTNIDSKLLIVIPAFNEELVLGKTLNELVKLIPVNQILVVSDGSTDKTSEIVKNLNINLLELPFNLGVGAAMRAGFQFALENGFSKIIQFDADLQHQPKYINELSENLNSFDVVVGSRFANNNDYKVSFVRSIAMNLLKNSV